MIKLNSTSNIYIFAPANVATGGPEALHQLNYYLKNTFNDLSSKIKLVYVGMNDDISHICEKYKKYNVEYISEEQVIDDENNVLIMPEIWTQKLNNYSRIQKCIWWLSVCFYDGIKVDFWKKYIRSIFSALKHLNFDSFKYWKDRKNYKKNCPDFTQACIYNFVGSKFAYDYLQKHQAKHVEYLVEPISKEFLDIGIAENLLSTERQDVVLYNPAKMSKRMEIILKRNSFDFVPLKGLSSKQLIEKYRSSKLYVDFGAFPGPERIPKETVYNGMVILVTKNNASVNDFDIAIPEKYKLLPKLSVKKVEEQMKYMLDNYDSIVDDFAAFREKIDNLENNFIAQIRNIFKFEE